MAKKQTQSAEPEVKASDAVLFSDHAFLSNPAFKKTSEALFTAVRHFYVSFVGVEPTKEQVLETSTSILEAYND